MHACVNEDAGWSFVKQIEQWPRTWRGLLIEEPTTHIYNHTFTFTDDNDNVKDTQIQYKKNAVKTIIKDTHKEENPEIQQKHIIFGCVCECFVTGTTVEKNLSCGEICPHNRLSCGQILDMTDCHVEKKHSPHEKCEEICNVEK